MCDKTPDELVAGSTAVVNAHLRVASPGWPYVRALSAVGHFWRFLWVWFCFGLCGNGD
jgi:hypothetical protein